MKLAVKGGAPVRVEPFPAYVTVDSEEKEAVRRVIDSGVLSRYLGAWHDQFFGGPEVLALEKEWAAYFGVKHAIAVNSASSGIICSLGAAGVSPGDEVIVTPWSMSISATAPLFYGGIPVFADVETEYFCLDPEDVERKITPKTKAIIAVDLFGQPYDSQALGAIAEKHRLVVIEDAAQAPGATLQGRWAGALGHMGVFSLNYHKHIQCGEGGVIVTDDDRLAERLRLIRNHAEAVVEGMGVTDLVNMVGFNFRMTELDAAVSRCQLNKLKELNAARLANVAYLEAALKDLPFLTMPAVRPDAEHVYYVHVCQYDASVSGVSAHIFGEAVKAELPYHALRQKEGTRLSVGYVRPIYNLPLFREKTAFGNGGWPFTLAPERSYGKGLCPTCERHHAGGVIGHEFIQPSMTKKDLDDVIEAFYKVWKHKDELI